MSAVKAIMVPPLPNDNSNENELLVPEHPAGTDAVVPSSSDAETTPVALPVAISKATSDSEADLSENVAESVSESGANTTAPYEISQTSDHNKTTNSSSHHDSEYDTASDTPSSGNELNDDDDDEEFEDDGDEDDDDLGDEEDDGDDDGSVQLDLERQRGDGEEQDGEKKKVDDDEDRSNPQYIPKRGVFYEHDDRTADDPDSALKGEGDEEHNDDSKPEEVSPLPKKPVKKSTDRWSHDRFNANEQAPKSRSELVNSYGYDIRSEEGPPRARRRRRYGSGPNKYTRKWEDESAYNKISSQQQQQQRNPRPEDFPELGTRKSQLRNGAIREEKENDVDDTPQQQKFRSPIRNEKLRNEKLSPTEDHSHSRGGGPPGPTTAERFADKNRSNQGNYDKRSSNYDGEKRSSGDVGFDGNRSLPVDHRFDGRDRGQASRQDRFTAGGGGGRHNERSFDENNRFDRQQNERFDGRGRGNGPEIDRDRSANDRQSNDRGSNDRSQSDRPFARNTSTAAPSSGYRTGKNTIEFKNQNHRNTKSGGDGPPQMPNNVNSNSNKPFNNSSGFGSGTTQSYESYADETVLDAKNFTNSKLERTIVPKVEHFASGAEFEPVEQQQKQRATGDRAITGRHGVPVANTLLQNLHNPNPVPLPLTSNSLLGNAPTQIHQQQHQQSSVNPQNSNSDVSRPKRYSALRQRSTIETSQQQLPQHVQNNPMSLHDQQQLMMQDSMAIQRQQQQQQQQQQQMQDQIQQIQTPNLAPTSSYHQQSLPPSNHSLATQQQIMLAAQQQQQQQQVVPPAATNSQYQAAAYYGSPVAPQQNDFSGPSSLPSSQQQQQSSQYPPQYGVAQNVPYISSAPQAQSAYLAQQQQQQQGPPPVVVQQQIGGQSVNYGDAPPSAVQPFAPVPAFPAYPPVVANYNSVSSGITYYAPQTQPPPRPILPQRRPTNAIPILAPPERAGGGKNRNHRNNTSEENEDDASKMAGGGVTIGSPENIDHILDNMFVQRAPYQPPTVAAPKGGSIAANEAMLADLSTGDGSKSFELNAGLLKMSLTESAPTRGLDEPADNVNDSTATAAPTS